MTYIGRTIQALEGLNMAESCGSSRIAGDQLAMTLIDPLLTSTSVSSGEPKKPALADMGLKLSVE
jgi:hypothetical protein